MKLATYGGEYDVLELPDGRKLSNGEPTEVTEEQARWLAAESRTYLNVKIEDAPDREPEPEPDDDQEAEA